MEAYSKILHDNNYNLKCNYEQNFSVSQRMHIFVSFNYLL